MYQSQKENACHGSVRGDKWAFAWTAWLCSGIMPTVYSQKKSLEVRVGHRLLKQTQMLISSRHQGVSVVQEGRVDLILFQCWFVNYYFLTVKQNMWGSIVGLLTQQNHRTEYLVWVALTNFWSSLWDFLTQATSLHCNSWLNSTDWHIKLLNLKLKYSVLRVSMWLIKLLLFMCDT